MGPFDVVIRPSAQPKASTTSSNIAAHRLAGTSAFAGEVAEVGSAVNTLVRGSRVVCCASNKSIDEQKPLERPVDASTVHVIPDGLSTDDAVELAESYIAAAAILNQHFGVSLADDGAEINKKHFEGKRILVIGGETLLAVALTQVFRAAETGGKVVLTATMGDQYMLLQRAVHLIMLGGYYAVDGAIPDLMDHLASEVDAIIDATGDLGKKPELLDLLTDGGPHLDLKSLDHASETAVLLEKGLPSWLQIGKLLKDAAEAFATVTESQCSLGD